MKNQITRIFAAFLLAPALLFMAACGGGGDDGSVGPSPNPNAPDNICDGVPPEDMAGATVIADCTEENLRAKLANGGKIQCDCGETTLTIEAPFVISAHTTLDGGGLTISGGQATRVFLKEPGAELFLQNITLRDGVAPNTGNVFDKCGGLILARGNDTGQAAGGNLTCVNVDFIDSKTGETNASDVAGGAVYVFNVPESTFSGCSFLSNASSNGGAVGNLGGDLVLINCDFENNQAIGKDGALTGHGGAINIDGVELSGKRKIFEVCGCRFSANYAEKQGGATNSVISDGQNTRATFDRCSFLQNFVGNQTDGNGGAIFHIEDDNRGASDEDNFSLTNSLFWENRAGKQGGALWLLLDGRAEVANCTFEGNTALNEGGSLGGAIALSGAGYGGTYDLRHLTLVNNTTEHFAGGIFASAQNDVAIYNSIFAGNQGTFEWEGHQVAGPATYSGSSNLQFPAERWNGSEDLPVPGRIFTEDPLLLPLADYGGPTFTSALDPFSPCANTGDARYSVETDQRGTARDGSPDLGAYEAE